MEKPKILIVDNDSAIRGLLSDIMNNLGYEYDAAEDGLVALHKLAANSYPIVITDIKMPHLDGIELTRKIKESYDADVMVITGHHAEYEYIDVIRAGASDFLSKPFDINELEAKLHRIIRERNLRRELERLSIRDELTNLYNRRHFNITLEKEASRAYRQGYSLFLILIDVDDFKKFNDQKGHQQGDILLCKLGKVILSSVRQNVDWGFRYGGDEFAAIITQATEDQASKIANRIRIKYNSENPELTTLSIGLAKLAYNPNRTLQKNMDTLVHTADKALYSAKNAGGDQIVFAGD